MSRSNFNHRVAQLERKRRSSWFGRSEGAPEPRIWRRAPARIALGLAVAGFVAKILMFVALGEPTYEARRDVLARESRVELVVAWLMQPDPVVRTIDRAVAALGF